MDIFQLNEFCTSLLQNEPESNAPKTSNISIDAPSDEICPINSIPRHVLAYILDEVSTLPLRSELRQVCQYWKYAMDTLVGTSVRIGTFSQFDPYYKESGNLDFIYHDPEIISQVGIDQLLVGNLDDTPSNDQSLVGWLTSLLIDYFNPVTEAPEPRPLPIFPHPSLVIEANFFGQISTRYFLHLMGQLSWVRVLLIDLCSLNTLDPSVLERLDLPFLESFMINGRKVSELGSDSPIFTTWDRNNILKNIMALTRNHFPKLKNVEIYYVYDTDRALEIAKSQLKFLQQHSQTINNFCVEYCLLTKADTWTENATPDHPDLLEIVKTLQKTLQLSRCRILPEPECLQKLPFMNVWRKIATEQRSLSEFAILGVYFNQDFITKLTQNNCRTLTVICIWEVVLFDDETLEVLQLDFGVFSECTGLKRLGLRGWTVTLSVKNASHADRLPNSLENIDFRDMAISTEDIRILCLEMPVLKTLDLHFVGNKREMGLNDATLIEVIARRQIKAFNIVRSFNGRLEGDRIFNGNDEDPEFIPMSFSGSIAFKMAPNGFYTQVPLSQA